MAISFRYPINPNIRITQYYGEHPEIYKQFGLVGHNGVDWGCPEGTPIYATAAGVVTKVAFDRYGYGHYMILDHGEGFTSRYAHFKEQGILVKVGQSIKQGQTIGFADNTGFSTGSHLHFEIRRNNVAFDPLQVLDKTIINPPDNNGEPLPIIDLGLPNFVDLGLDQKPVVINATSGLRVRSEPSLNGKILFLAKHNTRLQAIGISDDWVAVIGFCHKAYLKKG